MSLLYVMSLLAAGLFAEQRTFISVINLSIQNIQSNAACRRTSTCLFIRLGSDWAQFFQRNVHLLKFYEISLYVLKKISNLSIIPIIYFYSYIYLWSDWCFNNDSDSNSYFDLDFLRVCLYIWHSLWSH